MFQRIKISRRLIWVTVILGIVALLVWQFFLKGDSKQYQTLTIAKSAFAQQVTVSGNVVPAQVVDLGFSQGGRISREYAAVGDSVSEGSLIAEVENGDTRAVVSAKLASLQQQQANLNLLLAGTRPEQLAVTQSQIESDKTALVQANQGLQNAIQNAYTTSDDAVRNKVDQFISNPRSTSPQLSFTTNNSQLQTTTQNDRLATEALLVGWQKDVSALDQSSMVSAAQTAQSNLSSVMKMLTDANAALNAAITNQTVTQADIQGYVASISAARSSLNAAMSSITTAVSAQKNAAAVLDKDQKGLWLEKAGATTQSVDVARAQVSAAQADLQNAQAQLVKTQIVAPFSGVISKMDAKRGAIASPNTPVVSLISRGTFQIESHVPEVDIANVKVGNAASSTLDAYGPSEFFSAHVASIDPAQTVINGVSTYKTTLVFDAKDERIRSGMTASVSIQTGGVPSAIVIPRGAVYDHNNLKMVQLMQGKKVVDRPVTMGQSSLGNVVIVSGLTAGDVLILNPDTTK